MLFGHERGAFTGAECAADGFIANADGGTLFLDEVGELTARAQAALLRALQESRIVRVGATLERRVDFRLIAATHQNLEELVGVGTFRADLFYRLSGAVLRVPALRERREEIPGLVARFLEMAAIEWSTDATPITTAAMDRLIAFSWPGNIRQLRSVTRQAAASVPPGSAIEEHDLALPGITDSSRNIYREGADGLRLTPRAPLRVRLRHYERALIAEAIEATQGNVTLAASVLELPVRTLAYKIRAHHLDVKALRGDEPSFPGHSARSKSGPRAAH